MKHDFIDIMHARLSQHEMIEPSELWQDINEALDRRVTKKSIVASRKSIYLAVASVAAAVLVAVVMSISPSDDGNVPSFVDGRLSKLEDRGSGIEGRKLAPPLR